MSSDFIEPPQLTQLLVAWRGGDLAALDRLAPLVEAELRRLSRHYLRRERQGHILQTTALVNEAYLRLINWRGVTWENRAHFFGMAARLMRHVLVDLARQRPKGADGVDIRVVAVEAANKAYQPESSDLIAVDDALRALVKRDARKARIVELRFFGGLTLDEIADLIGVSPVTVSREWAKARAWLYREIAHQRAC